jgi:Spy/CpxP family protein refolding chaperone
MKPAQLKQSLLSRAVGVLGVVSMLTFGAVALQPAQAQMNQDQVAQAGQPAASDSAKSQRRGDRGQIMQQRRTEKMLDQVKASPEQRTKIREILAKNQPSAQARQEQMMAMQKNRKAMADAMAAPSIDRAAVERLRAERIAQMDLASKRRSETLLAVAEVLSPEQRVQAMKAMQEHGRRGGHGHHGGHGPMRGEE